MMNQFPLYIQVLAQDTGIEDRCKASVSHIYPGVRIETVQHEAQLVKSTSGLVMIDTTLLSKKRLEVLLNSIHDTPLLLILPDQGSAKTYCHLMSGRREMITNEELSTLSCTQAIHHLMERARLHEQLRKTSRRLKEASIRDDLTGLYNHHHFGEMLAQEAGKAVRYNRPLSLILIDFKNFAAVNELFGHHEGDQILTKTANILRETMRTVDILARFGDNAFAIILPETDINAATYVSERLLKKLSVLQNNKHPGAAISICFGVAALSEKTKTKEDILRSALIAVAESKRTGLVSRENSRQNELKENRKLIGDINEKFKTIGSDASCRTFHSMLSNISELTTHKKHLSGHSERVAFFARRMAENLIADESETIYRAGLFHDIGKLAIDPEILAKTTPLTANEVSLLHRHPVFGAEIMNHVPFLSQESVYVQGHHERFDGNGYPSGLKGSEIPLGARILAITEVWDAMVSPQPYRPTARQPDAALEELKKNAGKQFDPELVDFFTSLITG